MILGLALPSGVQGQTTHSHPTGQQVAASSASIADFIASAREATERYLDLEEAIGAGYRRVGPDFPGMGEHWVQVRRVLQRELDPLRPPILTYLLVDGRAVLTGVAYAYPVQPGEAPPDFIQPGLWHFHSGSIDEETLVLNPHAMSHELGDRAHLAMFHAWIWSDNPDGTFAQDNWALPFHRLGLSAPEAIPPQAGKALFLLTGGVAYYARLVELAAAPNEQETAAIEAILAHANAETASCLERIRVAGEAGPEEVDHLVSIWHKVWRAIQEAVSAETWARLAPLSG